MFNHIHSQKVWHEIFKACDARAWRNLGQRCGLQSMGSAFFLQDLGLGVEQREELLI